VKDVLGAGWIHDDENDDQWHRKTKEFGCEMRWSVSCEANGPKEKDAKQAKGREDEQSPTEEAVEDRDRFWGGNAEWVGENRGRESQGGRRHQTHSQISHDQGSILSRRWR
jgi:hypothetical protein